MKLSKLENLRAILELTDIKPLTPLSYTKVTIVNHTSEIELICLSTELLYQAKLSLDNGNFGLLDYKRLEIAQQLTKASSDILNNIYTKRDIKAICKECKIKNPL